MRAGGRRGHPRRHRHVERGACIEGDARINELRSGGVERADFVELVGVPGTSLDGWTLRTYDADGSRRTTAQLSGTIGDAGLWVGAFGSGLERVPDLDYGPTGVVGLASPAGAAELYDCAGTLLDAVAYGELDAGVTIGEGGAAPTPDTDAAIARCPAEFVMIDLVDSGDNAADFVPVAATPGEPNPMCMAE